MAAHLPSHITTAVLHRGANSLLQLVTDCISQVASHMVQQIATCDMRLEKCKVFDNT
jgi:hypothetical protein